MECLCLSPKNLFSEKLIAIGKTLRDIGDGRVAYGLDVERQGDLASVRVQERPGPEERKKHVMLLRRIHHTAADKGKMAFLILCCFL